MPTARYIAPPEMLDSATGRPHEEVTVRFPFVRFRAAGLGRVTAVRARDAQPSDDYECRVRPAVRAGPLLVDGTAIEIGTDDALALAAFRLHRGIDGLPDWEVT